MSMTVTDQVAGQSEDDDEQSCTKAWLWKGHNTETMAQCNATLCMQKTPTTAHMSESLCGRLLAIATQQTQKVYLPRRHDRSLWTQKQPDIAALRQQPQQGLA